MSTQGWSLRSLSPRREFATGKQVIERTYLIWGYSAIAVANNPESIINEDGQGLPAPGSSGFGLILDSYRVDGQTDGMVTAVATFSNFGYGRFPSEPIQDRLGYSSWSGDNWSGLIEIPVARRYDTIHQTEDISEIVKSWEPTTFNIRMGYERVKYRATVQEFGAAERRTLRAQNGNLHLINDGGIARYYHFEVGGYTQQNSGSWHINYSWTREDGVPRMTTSVDAAWDPAKPDEGSVFVPPTWTAIDVAAGVPEWGELYNDSGAGAAWICPPYHVLDLGINAQLLLADQPRYSARLPYSIDNNGHLTLPGIF